MTIENKRKLYQLEVINGTDPVSPTKDILYVDTANKQLKIANTTGSLEGISMGGTVCNPNMLYNSDFRSGCIERFTSRADYKNRINYSELLHSRRYDTVFCPDIIDDWLLIVDKQTFNYSGEMTLGNGYVTFSNDDATYNLVLRKINHTRSKSPDGYPIDTSGKYYGLGEYTLFIDCNPGQLDQRVRANIYYYDTKYANTLKKQEARLENGENTFKVNGVVDFVDFVLPPGSQLTIYAMKLEKGDKYTGMPMWSYGDEFAKCCRYKQWIYTPIIEFNAEAQNEESIFKYPLRFPYHRYPDQGLEDFWFNTKFYVEQNVNAMYRGFENGNYLIIKITNKDIGPVKLDGYAIFLGDYTENHIKWHGV